MKTREEVISYIGYKKDDKQKHDAPNWVYWIGVIMFWVVFFGNAYINTH